MLQHMSLSVSMTKQHIIRSVIFAAVVALSIQPVWGGSLPSRAQPQQFQETCVAMYAARDAGRDWPSSPDGIGRHCTLGVDGPPSADMSIDDYRWALRKSLTFACKGKREVIYDLIRHLEDCGGAERTFQMTPATSQQGDCIVSIHETGRDVYVESHLIDDLIQWRTNMPWYEAVLVDLFAPRELPMVMDGLIACGRPPMP